MKTQTLRIIPATFSISPVNRFKRVAPSALVPAAIAWPLALAINAAALVLSTWATSHGAHDALGAVIWLAGILLLAIAVDEDGGRALLYAGSGLLSLALAWSASRWAPEFGIAGALLASASLSEALFRATVGHSGRGIEAEELQLQD